MTDYKLVVWWWGSLDGKRHLFYSTDSFPKTNQVYLNPQPILAYLIHELKDLRFKFPFVVTLGALQEDLLAVEISRTRGALFPQEIEEKMEKKGFIKIFGSNEEIFFSCAQGRIAEDFVKRLSVVVGEDLEERGGMIDFLRRPYVFTPFEF